MRSAPASGMPRSTPTVLVDAAVAAIATRSGKGRGITATLKRDLYAPVLAALES